MQKILFGCLMLCAATANANANAAPKWAIQDAEVASVMLLPPQQKDGASAPPLLWLDLSVAGKSRSIAVSLCGPDLELKAGADVSDIALGLLSVERWEKLGWFGPVYQVLSGKIVFRFGTEAEKAMIEKEIREFREKSSCNYL